jgi:hypothetical protein
MSVRTGIRLPGSRNRLVSPDDRSVLKHQDYAWVTLLTCQGYDPGKNAYRYRRAVGAALVRIVPGS